MAFMLFVTMISVASAGTDGIIGNLQGEGQGALGFMKIIIVIIILAVFFGSPAGGYFLSTKIAKKTLKNEQEEDAGWKIYALGAVGAFAGIYIGYLAIGWFGSAIDPATGGTVDFAKGTNYIMSRVFSDMETVASGG